MNKITVRHSVGVSLPEPLKYTISGLIFLSGCIVAFLLYQMREVPTRTESDALIPLVETATIETFNGKLDLVVSGTVVPYREIKIGAEVGGRVLTKFPECEAGNYVKKGTKLIEIDPRDYNLEIKTMNSEIVQAEKTMAETDEEIRGAVKNLEIAQTDLKLQRQEFGRFENLKRSLAATEFDQAKHGLLNSESQLTLRQNSLGMLLAKKERLKASMELIKNRMEKSVLGLSRTIVTAPEDGVIVRESVEQGDFVMVAKELLVFEDTRQAEILCNLTPGELAWIRKYAPESSADKTQAETDLAAPAVYQVPRIEVQIFEQSDPAAIWKGDLARFDGIGRNETTKSIPCRIVVEIPVIDTNNGKRALVRGMYVKCRAVVPHSNAGDNLAMFPAIAVRPGDYIWVVRDEKLSRFDLEIIDRSPMRESVSEPKMVVVSLTGSGLETGDEVVVSPLPQPTEGGRVLLRQSTEDLATRNQDNKAQQLSRTRPGGSPKTEQRTKAAPVAGRLDNRERSRP